jgi:undecaprenyl-diphosphatase
VQEHLLPVLLTIRAAGFLLAVLALWGFTTLAYGILHEESVTFDKQVLLALRQLHTPLWDIVILGFTYIGEPITLLTLCAGLGLWLLKMGERSQATILVIAGVGAVILNNLLKILLGRERPLLWERGVDVGHYSFPSGHAMISLVIFGMIGYLLTSKFPQWQERCLPPQPSEQSIVTPDS